MLVFEVGKCYLIFCTNTIIHNYDVTGGNDCNLLSKSSLILRLYSTNKFSKMIEDCWFQMEEYKINMNINTCKIVTQKQKQTNNN